MITTVLFDLDGTLLPMDQDKFIEYYFGLLAKKLAPHGYEPHALINAVWEGTNAMVKNDGSCTNEEAFWNAFCSLMGEQARADAPLFQEFYENEFSQARIACGFDPKAAETVKAIQAKGIRTVLATNPLFPAIATENRIRWAGLTPEDFQLYTTFENYRHCKPNPAYYQDILEELGLKAEECLMVGNDASEDMVAEQLGIKVFLLPRCLVNRKNKDISSYPQGDFDALLAYIDSL